MCNIFEGSNLLYMLHSAVSKEVKELSSGRFRGITNDLHVRADKCLS